MADQNAKLSIFATRPAIYTPVGGWVGDMVGREWGGNHEVFGRWLGLPMPLVSRVPRTSMAQHCIAASWAAQLQQATLLMSSPRPNLPSWHRSAAAVRQSTGPQSPSLSFSRCTNLQVFNFICEFMCTTALIFGAVMMFERNYMIYEPSRGQFDATGVSASR